jgi:hypothetical protein
MKKVWIIILCRGELTERTAREDIQLLLWYIVEGGYVRLEVLGEDLLGDVCEPICELESGVYVEGLLGWIRFGLDEN